MMRRGIPVNGAYSRTFGLKTQARVVCRPLSQRAALRMLERGIFVQYPRGVRARLGAIPSLRRAFAARSLLCAPRYMEGAGGTPPDPRPA